MVCSIGKATRKKCSKEYQYRSSQHYTSRQWLLIKLRSGVENAETICAAHDATFLTNYEKGQKACCNPFGN